MTARTCPGRICFHGDKSDRELRQFAVESGLRASLDGRRERRNPHGQVRAEKTTAQIDNGGQLTASNGYHWHATDFV